MKKVAVIPVKENSERVKDKNFRNFISGMSLLEFKIRQLKESSVFSTIYVSSDSDRAKMIAEKNGVVFIRRDDFFCNNLTPWSDVIVNVLESLPENDSTIVAWCHTTSPTFDNYQDAMSRFEQSQSEDIKFDGLIAVEPINEFIIDETPQPLNYSWGVWHDYSQNLKKLYRVTGALFIASKREMIKNRYVISKRPILYNSTHLEGIDIDTEFDFRIAQLILEGNFNVKT